MKLKRVMCLVCLLFILAAGVVTFRIYKGVVRTLQEVYEINWGIDLPDGMKMSYNFHTPGSFHGDGWRYTIFSLGESDINADGFYKGSMRDEFAEEVLQKLEVPSEYWPDLSKQYIWKKMTKHNNTLFLVYDEEEQLLYVFEELI